MNVFDEVEHFYITPLLLLPLVENSFKHGICNIGNNWIRIDISMKDDWLSVKIENSYEPKIANAVNGNKGIGLDNVKKRLEILYHGRHEFKYMPDGHSFLTILKVKNLGIGVEPTCDHNNLPALVASNTEKLTGQNKNVVNL